MCGIAGWVNINRGSVDRDILRGMTDALAHRGPDDSGIYVDSFLGLGHRRLSIIDLSSRGRQPMQTEGGDFTITYNGEVYNYRELRVDLEREGVKFRTKTDTEVVLNCLAKRGPKALNTFNGIFAFALWNKKEEILTLARDRYGTKPLYLWKGRGILLFASEIKSFLRHPQFKKELDAETLIEYFTFQNTFTYKTLFKDVRLLPPGHFMQINLKDGAGIKEEKFWDFDFTQGYMGCEEECLERVNLLFAKAVERQLVSDVEIGSFLSGGIDSGSIVAVASRGLKELKTFCIGFDLSSACGLELSFDERHKAEHISYLCRTEHYEMVLKSGDMKRCLPRLVWALEDLRLGQSYPNFYASKLASSFVKVCLSGAGGDEVFAGYPWRYYKAPGDRGFDDYIQGYYRYWQRLIPNRALKELFAPIWDEVKDVRTEEIFREVLSEHKAVPQTPQDYINRSLYFEAKTFLHGLLVVEDKLSMAHGLEVRLPYLDNDLVDFATKIPVAFKLRDVDNILKIDEDGLAKRERYFKKTQDGKIILRKVFARYVGSGIAGQHKQGFSGPDASWFKGESIDYVKDLVLNKKAAVYNFLDYATARRLIEEHIEGRFNRRLFIWSILCFQWWLKLFMEGEPIPSPE